MRGHLKDRNPVHAAILYSLEHAREDLAKWTDPLSEEQLWQAHDDIAPVGFHMLHIAGSVDRLITYAEGTQLTMAQLEELKAEKEARPSRAGLFERLDTAFQRASAVVLSSAPERFGEVRELGRKRIPVTLGGLLIHIAEHTQRHVGEAIVTAKLAKSL